MFSGKKPKSKRSRNYHLDLGNCLSSAASNTCRYVKCTSRLNEKMITRDAMNYLIVDYKPQQDDWNVSLKTNCKTGVPLIPRVSHNKINQNNQSKKISGSDPKIMRFDKLDGLMLGNYDAFRNKKLLSEYGVMYVLDLPKFFKDDRNITHSDFLKIICKCFDFIDEHENHQCMIVCEKGVNRSVAVLMAYAILRKEMSFNDALNYIETQKQTKYPYWTSLTNNRLKNLLRSLLN